MTYDVSGYHLLLVAIGLIVILSYWLPRFVSGREPTSSALLIGLGLVALGGLGVGESIDPVTLPKPWEIVSELCVIVGLFGVGLRIDKLGAGAQWRSTIRLLLIAMPLCIAAVTLAGWAIGSMTLAGALLLGAVLAPTDPVLAGDIQVGPPLEGGEHPVRFTLTTEAGLNDGLAFPFVYLAVAFAAAGQLDLPLLGDWLLWDVCYRISVGTLAGAAMGWLLGKIMFDWPGGNALAKTNSALTAFAGVLIVYGVTEAVEGYGFIAAFVAGLTLRRQESRHHFHAKLHDFVQSIEHVLTALLLLALGAVLPQLWPHLSWSAVAIGLGLILVFRPLCAWLALRGEASASPREQAVVAFYGIRGIGSVYYVAYATSHIEMADKGALWATVAFTIVASTVIHGFTAGIAVERATREGEQRKRA
ncbi:cation:proton antiporter [Piscinibacter sakaiensis]|uniref:cation:proton antiporter n=1 Tax=Piscinibacter sakaiensis TaxID=1547922 RepID=UPI003AAB657E